MVFNWQILKFLNMKQTRSTITKTMVSLAMVFISVVAFSQDKATEYFNKGMEKFQERSFDSAIYYFTLALEIKPDYAEAAFRRGLSKNSKGLNDEALVDYNYAISLNPKPVYYNNVGMIKMKEGKFEEAMAMYDNAIDLDSNYLVALYNKGRLFLEMENTTDGCFYMKKAYFKGLTVVEDAINYFCN